MYGGMAYMIHAVFDEMLAFDDGTNTFYGESSLLNGTMSLPFQSCNLGPAGSTWFGQGWTDLSPKAALRSNGNATTSTAPLRL